MAIQGATSTGITCSISLRQGEPVFIDKPFKRPAAAVNRKQKQLLGWFAGVAQLSTTMICHDMPVTCAVSGGLAADGVSEAAAAAAHRLLR